MAPLTCWPSEAAQKVAIEVETGKSDVKNNLKNIEKADFDRCVLCHLGTQ